MMDRQENDIEKYRLRKINESNNHHFYAAQKMKY